MVDSNNAGYHAKYRTGCWQSAGKAAQRCKGRRCCKRCMQTGTQKAKVSGRKCCPPDFPLKLKVADGETNTMTVKRGANERVQACAGGIAHKNGDGERSAPTVRTSDLGLQSSDFQNSKWGTRGNTAWFARKTLENSRRATRERRRPRASFINFHGRVPPPSKVSARLKNPELHILFQ
jgi:hypothetical protein